MAGNCSTRKHSNWCVQQSAPSPCIVPRPPQRPHLHLPACGHLACEQVMPINIFNSSEVHFLMLLVLKVLSLSASTSRVDTHLGPFLSTNKRLDKQSMISDNSQRVKCVAL